MKKRLPFLKIIFLILIFPILFIGCSGDPEGELARDETIGTAVPDKSGTSAHIELKGRVIDGDSTFLQGQQIPFEISAGEIDSIEWCLYKRELKTGDYQRLICKRLSTKKNNRTLFSDIVTPSRTGSYKICMFNRNSKEAEEAELYSNPYCSRPFRVVSHITRISFNGHNDTSSGLFYMNDRVPFSILAGDRDGIESLHWRIEKRDVDSEEFKPVENASFQCQVYGKRLVTRTEYYTFSNPGAYRIIAFSQDRASGTGDIGNQNPQFIQAVKILGFRTKLEIGPGNGIKQGVYLFNTPVPFKIIADDIDGVNTIYWFVSKKNSTTGEFTYLEDTFHQYSIPGEVSVAIEEGMEFSSPGIYRISAFVADSLYSSGDKEHINPTVSEIVEVLGYTASIVVADNKPGETAVFCMNTPIQCTVEASDADGLGSIAWCTYKKNQEAGKYLLVENKCRDYQYTGETSVKIEESINFSEPGTYRIKIMASDILNRTSSSDSNPPVFQTIHVLGFRTMITVPSLYKSGNFTYPFDMPVPFEIVAEDVNGLDTVWWCIYKLNVQTGKYERIEESCKKEHYRGQEIVTLTGEVSIFEPGLYKISAFSQDTLYASDLPQHQNPEVLSVPFEISGYQTRFVLRGDISDRNSFPVKTPVLFQIRAKDVDGISSVGWCLSKMNPNTGKYDVINGSCQWDYFDGETVVSVDDEIHFIEPGIYRITVLARDAYYMPGDHDHQNPPDTFDFTITR